MLAKKISAPRDNFRDEEAKFSELLTKVVQKDKTDVNYREGVFFV